tara:strand:- start:1388 stop:4747 length:3360 start_codon:yes stop_codon:yes gene_type:complete
MAVATIKDLLDPLTKIQATSESSADSLDAISIALGAQVRGGEAVLKKLDKLIDAATSKNSTRAIIGKLDEVVQSNSGITENLGIILALKKQTKLLQIIAKGSGKSSKSGGGKKGKGAKDGAEALKALGSGAVVLAKGLILFNFVPKKGITKFKDTVFDLFEVMTKFKTKDLKEGAEAFKLMADSIGKFAIGLVKAAVLLPIGILGIKLLGFVIKMAIPIFENLGKKSKDINKGAKALNLMGVGLLSFAKGLALAGLVSVVALVAVPFLLLSIVLLAGAFVLLGKGAKKIRKGARALDKMGDALKSFAIGLAVFALVAVLTVVALPFMVASLLLIGGAVAILGGKKMAKRIRKGTANLALLGLGVALFGLGYGVFASQFPSNVGLMEVLVQTAAIAGIGLATALIGKFDIETIAKGALALVLNGAGLIVFALGYETYAKATKDVGLGDVLIQGLAILLISGAAALVGKFGLSNIAIGALALALNGIGLYLFSLGYTPFAESTKSMTLGDVGIQAAVIVMVGGLMTLAGIAVAASAGTALLGPALFAAAGGALLLLAPGLKAMRDLKYTETDAKELAVTLGAVTMAFSGVKEDDGFFGAIGSAFAQVGKSGAGLAAAALYAAAGASLVLLAKGLTAFKAVGFTEDDGRELAIALGAVSTAFAQAGGSAESPGGLFGAVFGNAFSPNAVEKGIDSVMNAGDALTSLAKGLTTFSAMAQKIDTNTLEQDIGKVVGFVSQAFAAVGGTDQSVESGGFFSNLLGIKSTATEEGIRSVKGAGDALTGIAEGLAAFKGLKDPATTAKSIGEVLGFVSEAFAAIGGEDQSVESGGFFSGLFGIKSTATEEGIRSVQGAGDELVKIGKALESFAGLKDPEGTATKIKAVLGMVGQAFAAIGGGDNEETDGNWFISWDENKIAKGIEAVDGAGDALTDIAAGLKAFSGDFQPEAVAASIGTLLTSIGTAFSSLYATNPEISPQLHDFADFIVTLGDVAEKGLLDKAADGISKIADSINKIDIDKTVAFGDLFNSSATLSEDKGAYKALASAVEEIRDMMQASGGGPGLIDKGLNLLDGGDRGAAKPAGEAKKGADPMKKLNSTLGRLEQAITALPTNIQTMKLEVSLPDQ